MDKLNIPCTVIISNSMDHAWNMVKVGGKWYHIDVTWDDPVNDTYGKARHDYFMLSDNAISNDNHNHYGWYSSYQATDTTYDAGIFACVDVPMYYYNGYWYWAQDQGSYNGCDGDDYKFLDAGLYKYSFKTDTVTTLLECYSIDCFGIYNGYAYMLTREKNIYTSPISNIKNITKLTELQDYDNWDGAYFENGHLYYALADEEYYQWGDDGEIKYSDYYKYRYFYSTDIRNTKKNVIKWNYADNVLTVDYSGKLPSYKDIDSPWAEYKNEIKYLKLGDSITKIESDAFDYYSELKCVEFPTSLTEIESGAFSYCNKLNLVFMSDEIQFIADNAFYGCRSLAGVFYNGSEAQWNTISFGESTYNLKGAEMRYNFDKSNVFKMFDIDNGIVVLEANNKALLGEAIDLTLNKYSGGAVRSYNDAKYSILNSNIVRYESNKLYAAEKGCTEITAVVGNEDLTFPVYIGEKTQMRFTNTNTAALSGTLIIASYLNDGSLAGCVTYNKNIDAGGNINVDYIDYGGKNSGFMWNSISGMQPIMGITAQ